MKNPLALLAAGMFLTSGVSSAATLYWYPTAAPNEGGTGTWTGTNAFWSTTSGATKTIPGTAPAAGDNVVFGGTAGLVSVLAGSAPQLGTQLNDWKVETSNYVFRSFGSGFTYSVNSFSGAGLSTAVFESNGNNANIFNIRSDTAFNGTIRNGPGTTSVTKSGTGAWDLSGATLTYTNVTSIIGGSLWLSEAQIAPNTGLANTIRMGNNDNTSGVVVVVGTGGTTTFNRALGTGTNQVVLGATLVSTTAGFGSRNGTLNVNLGGASAEQNWVGNSAFRATNLILGTADSTGTVVFQNGLNISADNRVLQIGNGSQAVDAEISAALRLSGGGSGDFILTKAGAGTLLLSGSSSAFVGRFNASEGRTLVNGTLASTTSNATYGINVASGAILGGDGALTLSNSASKLTVAGTLLGGQGAGNQSLTINSNLEMTTNSVLAFGLGLNATDRDQIIRSGGTWSFQSNQRIQLFDAGYNGGELSFALITGLAGDPNVTGWSLYNSDPGISGAFRYDTGTIYFDAVPEPATWVLFGIGAAAVLWYRRRS